MSLIYPPFVFRNPTPQANLFSPSRKLLCLTYTIRLPRKSLLEWLHTLYLLRTPYLRRNLARTQSSLANMSGLDRLKAPNRNVLGPIFLAVKASSNTALYCSPLSSWIPSST